MAYLTFTSHGCVVSKPDKQQQIALSHSQWDSLCSLRDPITAFLTVRPDAVCRYWCLPSSLENGGRASVRVTLSRYEGGSYVNLRVYMDDQPTKQGVVLNLSNWLSLGCALGESEEASMGREVYRSLLRESASSRSPCEGCVKGWESQRDHDCATGSRLFPKELLAELPPVSAYDFAVELAILGRIRECKIERPLECYEMCTRFHHESIMTGLSRSSDAV